MLLEPGIWCHFSRWQQAAAQSVRSGFFMPEVPVSLTENSHLVCEFDIHGHEERKSKHSGGLLLCKPVCRTLPGHLYGGLYKPFRS